MIWLISSRSGEVNWDGVAGPGRVFHLLTRMEDAAPSWPPPGNYNVSELQAKARGSSSLGPNSRSCAGFGGSCVRPQRDPADAEWDSSLQSSRAGWLITQTGPRGVQLMRAPTVLGGALLCPPTRRGPGPPPAPCGGEGRAGSHTRGTLAKDPAVLLEDVPL